MYDGILFDKDGVLLNSCPDGFTWIDRIRVKKARERGYTMDVEDAERLVHSRTRQEVDDFLRSKGMTWNDFVSIERAVSNAKIDAMKSGEIKLFPNSRDVLSNIELPKALVSNAFRRTTDFVLDYFDLAGFFEDVESPRLTDRGFVEMKKPNTVMLEKAIDSLGLENPLMVGDTSADVGAAEKLGIDSLLVDRHNALGLEPTYRVQNLGEFRELFEVSKSRGQSVHGLTIAANRSNN